MESLETLRRVHKVEVPESLENSIDQRIQMIIQEEKKIKVLLPLLIAAILGLGYNFYQAKKATTNSSNTYPSHLSSQLYNE